MLASVYHGRNLHGVKPGQIKKLLVLEDLPKPGSKHGLPGMLGWAGSPTLRRVLGTMPVEADVSAPFEVPTLRALYLLALDEHDLAVKRSRVSRWSCLAWHGTVGNLGRRGRRQRDERFSEHGKPPETLNSPLYCWNLYRLSQPASTFRHTSVPNYQTILQAVRAAQARQRPLADRICRASVPATTTCAG